MVRDVFDQSKLEQLVGSMGVGHGMSDTDSVDGGSSFLLFALAPSSLRSGIPSQSDGDL